MKSVLLILLNLSGDPVEVILPQTKIILEISTTKFIIYKRPNDGHGVIPDYTIIPGIKDMITGSDIVKDDALKQK